MNSALKPVLPQPGVPQPGGQASPAKANVASANHTVALPQGAQNSLHHGSNNLVGQNLTHHVNAPPVPPHAVPSMAPVTANMAQMAQNMSHHGNLSHVTQNSVPPPIPSKPVSTSAPLSLVQEKANTSQPLALTRTPEKKEPDSSSHANGTIESSKTGTNAPTTLKAQNPETNKDKQDIAKTSPSTPKPPEKSPEKPSSTQCTPQKIDSPNTLSQTESPAQPKVATANEAPEKSPTKPSELKPTTPAVVAPTQGDLKPVPETANSSQDKVSPSPPQEQEPVSDSLKPDSPLKPEEKKEEPSEKPPLVEEKKEDVKDITEPPKEEQAVNVVKPEEKVEEKKVEAKTTIKPEVKATPKSTMKLATVTPPLRKRRQLSPTKATDGVTPAKKLSDVDSTPDTRIKRNRTKVQLYQSPTPEIAMATKLSASAGRSTPTKPNDDKLIVFYKNEYLAVRNAEGGFYVCQTVQNVYRTTRKIKIRWLSQDKTDPSGETYKPDFYDVTDMECVLTTLSLTRAPAGGGAQLLKPAEEARAKSILERAIKAEQSGANNLELTEEHPDGLVFAVDLSLYTDESQLEKARKRRSSKSSRGKLTDTDTAEEETPIKKSRTTPKRSPKHSKRTSAKRRAASSSPAAAAAAASKVGIVRRIYRHTATAVTEKTKAKVTPAKRAPPTTPATTPPRKPRRTGKESKPSPIVPTPSTSTGKTTRTPRKPPAKK
ncbi:PREDICTED: muscle M-line assembly protein unc-89-like isoform X1 [Papilio xuthus]|uniref:Muscle M-line assembly protein unc-89-like isoform X1 n=1 Tax=Papilio xuthus TaxID=66420 RepID=A0AAJ6ZJ93_PAPXU|nr:PREDICTED: muscle M-line assembly protein unc-89-like isoform X1 [Papilio xuthus]